MTLRIAATFSTCNAPVCANMPEAAGPAKCTRQADTGNLLCRMPMFHACFETRNSPHEPSTWLQVARSSCIQQCVAFNRVKLVVQGFGSRR